MGPRRVAARGGGLKGNVMLSVNDRVRYSGYALRAPRDAWNQCGREPAKSVLKRALDAKSAERGTVIEVLSNGVKVKWDGGWESSMLSYIVERVEA